MAKKTLRIGYKNYLVPPMVISAARPFSKRLGRSLEFLGPLLAFIGFSIAAISALDLMFPQKGQSESKQTQESMIVSTDAVPGESRDSSDATLHR